MDYDELFPNEFIHAGELQGKSVTVTIASINLRTFTNKRGEEEVKPVVTFDGKAKKYVMNKTMAICMRAMFGRKVENWLGKRVLLYPKKIDSGIAEWGIRVYGSPDIEKPVQVDERLGRGQLVVTMHPTGKQQAKPNGKAAAPPPEPEPLPEKIDEQTGEVFSIGAVEG